MQLVYACPVCSRQNRVEVSPDAQQLSCPHCDWQRSIAVEEPATAPPRRCLVCGCEDLWRQKDFPPQIGLAIVGLGALLSTIAWADRRPVWALGILMAFALLDLLLYALMKDVLVCYRCGGRHRHTNPGEEHPRFNLETAERYRQEAKRLQQSGQ